MTSHHELQLDAMPASSGIPGKRRRLGGLRVAHAGVTASPHTQHSTDWDLGMAHCRRVPSGKCGVS